MTNFKIPSVPCGPQICMIPVRCRSNYHRETTVPASSFPTKQDKILRQENTISDLTA